MAPLRQAPTNPDSGRILIVDDDEDVRLMCRLNLEPRGFEVAEANSPDLITVARKFRPDVILLDLFMPQLDGWDCLQALGRDDTLSDVPVIMMSGSETEALQSRGRAAGVHTYIVKPFLPSVLGDTVKALCDLTPRPGRRRHRSRWRTAARSGARRH